MEKLKRTRLMAPILPEPHVPNFTDRGILIDKFILDKRFLDGYGYINCGEWICSVHERCTTSNVLQINEWRKQFTF